MKIVDSDIIKN